MMGRIILKSKFSLILLLYASLALFSIAVSTFCILKAANEINKQISLDNIISFIFFICFIIAAVKYLSNISIITYYENGIRFQSLFKSDIIEWRKTRNITLITEGRENFFLPNFKSALVANSSSEKFYIPLKHYSNICSLLLTLEKIKKEGLIHIDQSTIVKSHQVSKEKKSYTKESTDYSGSIFKALHIYLFLLFLSFIFFISFSEAISNSNYLYVLIFFIPALVIFYIGFGSRYYYFNVYENHISILNTFFFWKNREFYFDEIRELFIEQPTNSPKTLVIITSDFMIKSYGAESLNNKTWIQLVKDLESKKVKVKGSEWINLI